MKVYYSFSDCATKCEYFRRFILFSIFRKFITSCFVNCNSLHLFFISIIQEAPPGRVRLTNSREYFSIFPKFMSNMYISLYESRTKLCLRIQGRFLLFILRTKKRVGASFYKNIEVY